MDSWCYVFLNKGYFYVLFVRFVVPSLDVGSVKFWVQTSRWKTCVKIPSRMYQWIFPQIIVTSSDKSPLKNRVFKAGEPYVALFETSDPESWQETQDVQEIPFGGELSEEGTTNTSRKCEVVRLSFSWSSCHG